MVESYIIFYIVFDQKKFSVFFYWSEFTKMTFCQIFQAGCQGFLIKDPAI